MSFLRCAEVFASDDRRAVHDVPKFGRRNSARGAAQFVFSRHQFCTRRKNATSGSKRFCLRSVGTAGMNEAKFQLSTGLEDFPGANRIAYAGKLNQDLVVFASVKLNRRLGQTEQVNAAPNCLD